MNLGIVIYSNDPETVWNALRLANFSIGQGDKARVFLLAKGVELENLDDSIFKVKEQATAFRNAGGMTLACGTCLKQRKSSGSALCPMSTMKDLYRLISECDKVVTF